MQEAIFWKLYRASTETEVDEVIRGDPEIFAEENWKPYGGNYSNFGVVENQQASAIPALIEKIINGIDAILMRRCLEQNIDPRSIDSPRSVAEAIERLFPDASDWDLPKLRRNQAGNLQIIADGPRFETSLVVYDNGEGQHPCDFERTFLSLLRGNKTEIHFVQGKYNMGGAGAIAFCGRKRYQLVCSRRYDMTGDFGFTLLRRHPLSERESETKRATWYEYITMSDMIPRFEIDEINLGLNGRLFSTGTAIKLYSYDLPTGARSVISRDLNQSINEYLFRPALPVLTVDSKERYPQDKNLERDLYGLKRRLEADGGKYITERFSEDFSDAEIGNVKITTYVFTPRMKRRTAKETRVAIRREFFKNNMTVLFSLNGQVHGHCKSEFVSRSLKMGLLKDYLLIHVDCSRVKLNFRTELFMASRDRLKNGKESRKLRNVIASKLLQGRLREVYKARKASLAIEGEEVEELIKNLTRNVRLKSDLLKLVDQALKLDQGGARDKKRRDLKRRGKKQKTEGEESETFVGKRFPSFFRLESKSVKDGGLPLIRLPLGGQRNLRFATDVEDQYFDRTDEPGNLSVAILDYGVNEGTGGAVSLPGTEKNLIDVSKASPKSGTIRVSLGANRNTKLGDRIRIAAVLSGAGEDFEAMFFVKIIKKRKSHTEAKAKNENYAGLPALYLVDETATKTKISWETLEARGIEMNHGVVMFPLVEGDVLREIYVNLDSRVLLNYRSRLRSAEALKLADNRYVSSVYFHTLFLYVAFRANSYSVDQSMPGEESVSVDLGECLRGVFSSHYSEFLLGFDTEALVAALDD